MKLKITEAINYLNLFSAVYLTASVISDYYPIRQVALELFFISFLIEIFLEKKRKSIQFDRKRFYFIILALFFMIALLSYTFDDTPKYFNYLLTKRYPLIAFALVGFFGLNKKFKLNYFLNTFIITSIATIIYLVFFQIGILEFISNSDRALLFCAERIKHINSHMQFNFYLNISLIGIWYILTRSWKRTIWWKRYLYIAAMTVIIAALSISEGRSGFIAGIILMFSFTFFEIWKRRKAMGIVIGLLIPFLAIGIASQHQRMGKKSLETEPRLFLWQSAVEIIKDKPIWGYGLSNAQEKLDEVRPTFQSENYRLESLNCFIVDCHNQYLQTTMELGIFGLLILLFLYTYPIFIVEKNRKLFTILILFLCAYQSVFDMFITGHFSTIFCILILLMLSVENNIVEKKKAESLED
jgi:O-antigen ligase